MPSTPMILRIHFYHAKGQGKTALASAAHHADYMLSPEKAELLVDDRTSLESAVIHAKYADEREGSMGSFGTIAQAEARKQMLRAQGPVWRLIVSVGEADALSMGNGLTTKAGWEQATQAAMADTLRAMRLDPANTEWIAAAHRKQANGEHNPHIHLLLWERGEPHRRTGTLTQDEIGKVRRALASALYRPELDRIGAQKTQARDRSKALTRAIFGGMELEQGFVHALADRLAMLGDHLPAKGRLAYAYLPSDAKAEVMGLAHWLSESQADLKAAKAEFLEAAKEFAGVHWAPPDGSEWRGSDQAAKRQAALDAAIEKADQDFHQRLVGEILRGARSMRSRKIDPALRADVKASRSLRRQIRLHPEKAGEALRALHPELSALRIQRQIALLRDHLERQTARHRTVVVRSMLRSILMGLRGDDGRYQAYLSAKDRYAKEKAEWEVAMAQGIQIAR